MTELAWQKRILNCCIWGLVAEPEVLEYIERKVAELEGVEKADRVGTAADFADVPRATEKMLDGLARAVAKLRTDLKAHAHCNGDSGKCYYP